MLDRQNWMPWMLGMIGSTGLVALIYFLVGLVGHPPKVEISTPQAAVATKNLSTPRQTPKFAEDHRDRPVEVSASVEAPDPSLDDQGAAFADDEEGAAVSQGEISDPAPQVHDGNVACEAGSAQSPINIEQALVTRDLRPLIFSYSRSTDLKRSGRGAKPSLGVKESGAALRFQSEDFALEKISAKFPSEHMVDGEQFAAELQFHHAGKQGKKLIMSVLLRGGSASEWSEQFLSAVDSQGPFNLAEFIPEDKSYYQYVGSLTEPPCFEGVTWIVLKKPMFASDDILRQLQSAIGTQARPLQALNQRRTKVSVR